MTTQERSVSDIFPVDFQSKAGWQQDTKRRKYAQDAGTVRELLKIYCQADVVAVFCRHALNQGAYFVFGAGWWWFANHLPITVLGNDIAIDGALCRSR
jgi:hypothetical protein